MVTHPDASLEESVSNGRNDFDERGTRISALEGNTDDDNDDDDDDDDDEDILGFKYAIIWLGILTVFISLLSDMLVDTIEPAAKQAGAPTVFIATIIVPIIGNAAEHASAVIFAMRNKLDLSLGVAIGSATQIAIFVLPLLVVLGWLADKPLSLNFQAEETASVFFTVILVTFAIKDGSSNWFLGVILLVAYLILAGCLWVHKDEDLDQISPSPS